MGQELTESEIALLNLLGDCWNKFSALPDHHPADAGEFVAGIHALQNMVMGRLAVRVHPDLFWNVSLPEEPERSAEQISLDVQEYISVPWPMVNPSYSCPTCGATRLNGDQAYAHKNGSHLPVLKCLCCDFRCSNTADMHSHYQEVHPDRQQRCHADRDGDCNWSECPQLRNYESSCPLIVDDPER